MPLWIIRSLLCKHVRSCLLEGFRGRLCRRIKTALNCWTVCMLSGNGSSKRVKPIGWEIPARDWNANLIRIKSTAIFGAGNLCQHSRFDAPNLAECLFHGLPGRIVPVSPNDVKSWTPRMSPFGCIAFKCSHPMVQLITPFMLVFPGCFQCFCQPCPINFVVCVFRHSIKWWICYLQTEPGIIGSVVTHTWYVRVRSRKTEMCNHLLAPVHTFTLHRFKM